MSRTEDSVESVGESGQVGQFNYYYNCTKGKNFKSAN